MKLAYVDACVWITLIEGLDEYRPPVRAALASLANDGWELCTSDAVHLEVLFRPLRLKQERLCGIYRTLLDETRSLAIPQTVFADALSMATSEGLKAMDAVHYAIAKHQAQTTELERLSDAGRQAVNAGMRFHAGHGLNYTNVRAVAAIPEVAELNIGHSIVSRAVMVGMREAVAEMRRILDLA